MKKVNPEHKTFQITLAISEIVIFLGCSLFMWLQAVSCVFILDYGNSLADCLVLWWGISLFATLPFYVCSYIGKNKLSIIFPLLAAATILYWGVKLQVFGPQFGMLYALRGVCIKYFYYSLIPCILAVVLYIYGRKQGSLLYFALIGAFGHFVTGLILQVYLVTQPYCGFSTGLEWLLASTVVMLEIGLRCFIYKREKKFLYTSVVFD